MVQLISFSADSRVYVHCFPGEVVTFGCSVGQKQASGGNILLENPGYSHSCEYILRCLHPTLNTVVDKEHPSWKQYSLMKVTF